MRIEEIYPNVESIRIEYKITYEDAIRGRVSKESSVKFSHGEEAYFKFRCANEDCSEKYFDLKQEVSSAVWGNGKVSGTKRCLGMEAPDHRNRCPTTMEYSVLVEYRKGSPR